MAGFMEHFQGNVAREVGRLRKWRAKVAPPRRLVREQDGVDSPVFEKAG